MISMKLTIVLYANLLCLPAMAQRDFKLTQQRNPWLTANNAAALTTYADSTIAHATLSYRHDGGKLHTMSEGKRQETYDADVRQSHVQPTQYLRSSRQYAYAYNEVNAVRPCRGG